MTLLRESDSKSIINAHKKPSCKHNKKQVYPIAQNGQLVLYKLTNMICRYCTCCYVKSYFCHFWKLNKFRRLFYDSYPDIYYKHNETLTSVITAIGVLPDACATLCSMR